MLENRENGTPKVSIIVAIYNVEKYIEKCIQSLIDQTYQNIEIILVDDCSPDKSGDICDEMAKKDSRIKVIHHEINKKQSTARNNGLDISEGEYVYFVDGDDWIMNDCIEYMVKLIESTNCDMAISKKIFTTRDKNYIQDDDNKVEIWTPEFATAQMLYSKIPIGAWNKIYRLDFINSNKIRFHKDIFMGEGYRFISDLAQRANQVAVGNRKVYFYRLNNTQSATTKPDIKQGLGALFALEGIERDLIIKTPLVLNSLYHHKFINHHYTLMIIIESKTKKENKDVYKNCIRYMKQNGKSVANAQESLKRKIKVYAMSLFPTVSARYYVLRKKIGLYFDLKNEKRKSKSI